MSDEVNTMNDAEKSVDPGPSLSEQLQAALLERDQFKDKWTRALADHDSIFCRSGILPAVTGNPASRTAF